MKASTYLSWLTRMLIAGALVGATTASASGAVGRPPDVRDAATSNSAVPDVFERYAAAHPFGSGLSVVDRIIAQERARHGDPTVFGLSASTPRSSALVMQPPDVQDAAQAVSRASSGLGDGFDWADYAIGIGSGIGLSLLIAAGLGSALQRRGRVQTA